MNYIAGLSRRWCRWLVLWCLTCVSVGVPVGGASAKADSPPPIAVNPDSDGAGVRRTAFLFNLSAGTAQSDSVVVSNLGDQTVNVRLYAANAFTTQSGKIGVKSFSDEIKVPATWLRFTTALGGDGVLQIPPKTAKKVPFSVYVPSGAAPGDYALGVGAMPVIDAAPSSGQDSVQVVLAAASLILVRVQGQLNPSISILDLETTATPAVVPGLAGGESTVKVLLVNTGNQKLSAKVRITQVDALGHVSYRYPELEFKNLLPGSEIPIRKGWPDAPTLRGRVQVEVTTDAGVSVTRSKAFWSVPWSFLGIIVGTVVLLLVVRRARRRWKRQTSERRTTAESPRSGFRSKA